MLGLMKNKMLALVIGLLVNSSLAYGQSAVDTVTLPCSYGDNIQRSSEGENAAEFKSREPLFVGKGGHRIVAASAEDAEIYEAATRKADRIWIRTEYLVWWIKSANFPPLVTSGEFTDARPGALDSLSTNVLFGRNGMDFQDRGGGRFTGGWWLDDEQKWGMDAGYFFLSGRSLGQGFTSSGSPVLATPFFNVNSGLQDSSLVTFPGVMTGRVVVDAPSFLQGAEANLTAAFWQTEHVRLEALVGFRYLNLNEGLHINATSLVELAPQFVGLVPLDGNTITVSDFFDTRTQFYGGQMGMRAEVRRKRWILELLGKVALGVSHETVSIRGFTGIDTQPATSANGGLFAVSSNSGQFSRNVFAVVPEVGLNLKFELTDHIRIFGGYSFLYWSNVVRPGDQVDTAVNLNLVPTSMTFGAAGGPSRPGFAFHSTSFFAHGANFGVEFRY
jgi:Putative beta barrel porin-7 (BBP7)